MQAKAQSLPPPPDTAAPPVAPEPPQPNASVTLADGSQVRGTVLLYQPGQKLVLEREGQTLVYEGVQVRDVVFDAAAAGSAATPSAPAAAASPLPRAAIAEYVRAQELMSLAAQRERLLASNRRWQLPTVGIALGIVSIAIGANQFASAVGLWASDCSDDCGNDEVEADRRSRAGAALITIGSTLFLVSMPLLIVWGSRASRLRDVERAITRLGGKLTLTPALLPRAEVGLRARFAF
jgi:hypothetical protein